MRSLSSAFPIGVAAALLILSAAAPAGAQSQSPEGQKAAPQQTRPQIPIPARKKGEATPPSRRAECAWLGQRVVSLLWRDDVNTAREQTRFYEMFGCPVDHLPVAFRCVIEQSESQPDQNDLTARVYGCWMSPEGGAVQE